MSHAQLSVREDISAAIRRFLYVLEGGGDAGLYDLAKALDALVATYHRVPDVSPDTTEASAAPAIDEQRVIEAASAAFPDLGCYALVDPQEIEGGEIGLSISAGDLAEIAADLSGVLWLFENAGYNDAVWEFRFGYQMHWGRHLHELRTYLHALAAW
jgi:hypothetical protein